MDDGFEHYQQKLERGFKDLSTSGHKKDLIETKHITSQLKGMKENPTSIFACRCSDGAMENATLLSED